MDHPPDPLPQHTLAAGGGEDSLARWRLLGDRWRLTGNLFTWHHDWLNLAIYLFNYIYFFIHFVVLGQRRCRPALLPILLIWFKPVAPTWSVQSKGSGLSSTSRGAPIRTNPHRCPHTEFNHGQVFALRPTLPLLTPAESLEGESPHWWTCDNPASPPPSASPGPFHPFRGRNNRLGSPACVAHRGSPCSQGESLCNSRRLFIFNENSGALFGESPGSLPPPPSLFLIRANF